MTTSPQPIEYRNAGNEAALVFIHGFGGDTKETWAEFPTFITSEPRLSTWDVYATGFPSSLRIDIPNIWSADPGLDTLALGLSTALTHEPFRKYKALAVAAHSMGGLITQRAILNDKALRARISHVLLYGTPSGGLVKASLLSLLKRQFRDMSASGDFIKKLRDDWRSQFGTSPSFSFRATGGDRDEFVPPTSSLDPFRDLTGSDHSLAVVPGNHVEIVKPATSAHLSVRLMIDCLTGADRPLEARDSARLAVEMGQFKKAVDLLEPKAAELDDNALVDLALAYDGLGQSERGIKILEQHYKGGKAKSLDILGTLAGRFKRRWLVSRVASDYNQARQLYEEGFKLAEQANDHAQAYYHGINVAFLELMNLPVTSPPSPHSLMMAQKAFDHCQQSQVDQWRRATEAEAKLIMGDPDKAYELYGQAKQLARVQREVDSMYLQAVQITGRLYGDEGLKRLQQAFNRAPLTAQPH